jgi:membrane fusion protein (multidrug efflux system)
MIKRIIITIVGLLIVVGILGGVKGLQIERMVAQGKQFSPPPEPVNTAVARKETWESFLTSVGSLEAVQGVIMTAELPGKVERIGFEPGTKVKVGELLLQQDISAETAQLRAAEATLTLAKIELDRRRKLLSQKTISRSEYDNAEAQFKQAAAQADNIRAVVKKKTIRAPFDGHLGIRLVNVGQVLKEGEAIVSLQSIDPIFVNFSLPQQQLARVKPGLIVRVTTDALPGQSVEGKITAINPQVDTATRNIQMQATAANHDELLRPGMFVNIPAARTRLSPSRPSTSAQMPNSCAGSSRPPWSAPLRPPTASITSNPRVPRDFRPSTSASSSTMTPSRRSRRSAPKWIRSAVTFPLKPKYPSSTSRRPTADLHRLI